MKTNFTNYSILNKTPRYSTNFQDVEKTLEIKKEILEFQFSLDQRPNKSTEEAYIELISQIIIHLGLKNNQSQSISITFNVEDLSKINENSIPFNVKKFSSNVRVASNSPFGRNLLEVFLLPISRNVSLDETAIKLSQDSSSNYSLYRNLMLNNKVREAVIKYIDQIPSLGKGVVTTKTTLKSFQKGAVVQDLWSQLKQNNLSLQGRYIMLGLFLESILFETVNNTVNKHSKARIINFLIELISKAGI